MPRHDTRNNKTVVCTSNLASSEYKSSVSFPNHACVIAKSLQSCPTLCDLMDCSLPGSSVHEILQARILEWVAISSSRGSSRPSDQTCISYGSCIAGWSLPLSHWKRPTAVAILGYFHQVFFLSLPTPTFVHGVFVLLFTNWGQTVYSL